MPRESNVNDDFIVMEDAMVSVSEIERLQRVPRLDWHTAHVKNETERYLGGVNADSLVAHLYKQGFSTVEIGRQLDVHPNTLTWWLKGAGIPLRSELKGKIGLYSGKQNRIAK